MTSKNSTIRPSLWQIIRENLRHNSILIILSVLGGFMASPVTYMYYVTNIIPHHMAFFGKNTYEVAMLQAYLPRYHLMAHAFVLVPGAVLVAVVGFRYLFHRKMTDLYNSTPITRTRRFWAQYLTGFLIWFVPFLIGSLFIMFAGSSHCVQSGSIGILFRQWITVTLVLILCFLIIYHISLISVMISGNAFAAIINLVVLSCGVGCFYLLYHGYAEQFFETYYAGFSSWVYETVLCLSPAAAVGALCVALAGGGLAHWMGLLVGSIVLCAFHFGLAMLLHQKKASEAAESGVDNTVFRITLRLIISILCGLFLALFFSYLVARAIALWIVFGGIFGTIVAFCVMNVIYHASFKSIFRHRLQMAVAALLVCITALSFRYDVFGYDSYVPAEKDIVGLSLNCSGLRDSGHSFILDESSRFYQNSRLLEAPLDNMTFTTDPALIHDMLDTLVHSQSETDIYRNVPSPQVCVRVDTTTGSYYRCYRAGSAAFDAIAPLLSLDEFRDCYYPASSGQMKMPDRIDVTSLDETTVMISDPARIQALYKAYAEDFKQNYAAWDYYYHALESHLLYAMVLCYEVSDQPDGRIFPLKLFNDNFQQTITLLEEWYPEHVWTQDDIKISRIDIRFPLRDTSPAAYLGLEDSGGQDPFLQPYLGIDGEYVTYSASITDPDQIDRLLPYLRITQYGSYYDADHVYIGYLATSEYPSRQYSCFIELGAMPEDILALIHN